MVEIPKRGGGPTFGENSQIIPYFFFESFPIRSPIWSQIQPEIQSEIHSAIRLTIQYAVWYEFQSYLSKQEVFLLVFPSSVAHLGPGFQACWLSDTIDLISLINLQWQGANANGSLMFFWF